jgi:hypothetical protein
MSMAALGMSVVSLVFVTVTVVAYFRSIPRNEVPVEVTRLQLELSLGVVLAGAAVVWSVHTVGTVGVAVVASAALAATMAVLVLWLLTQRKTPIGDLKVKVGDALLPFEATTASGAAFHSDELAGKRTLLKFFRGGW